MTPRRASLAVCAAAIHLLGCEGPEPRVVTRTAVEHGAVLFRDPAASPSARNRFACLTCHTGEPSAADAPPSPTPSKPGGPLAGVTRRPSYWAGAELDLLRAVNACRYYFMGASAPWSREDEEARALYAFLATAEGSPAAQPFTVVARVEDLAPGDPTRGNAVYDEACRSCHGRPGNGDGRLTPDAPRLPDETRGAHPGYSAEELRRVFVQKVRHGVFFGYGGTMPPFASEALSDEDLGALLAYLSLY